MFSHLFLERYIPLTRRDELRGQFKHLQHDCMLATEYEAGFIELSRHETFLIPIEVEKVRRFIEGLAYGITVTIARESEIWTTFH